MQLAAYSIWFTMDKAPWNDVRVRRAVSLALDRDELIASNRGAAVYGGVVPSSWILMAVPTPTMTGSQYQEDAEVVQHLLAAVGINAQVTIEGRTWSPIWTQRKYPDLGWGGAPGAHILNDLVKAIVETGTPRNTIKFSDPGVDRLAKAQAAEYDLQKRVAIVDRLQDRLYETLPYVPGIPRVYPLLQLPGEEHRVDEELVGSYRAQAVLAGAGWVLGGGERAPMTLFSRQLRSC